MGTIKTKIQYKAEKDKVHGRDKFQTPFYAINLLEDFIDVNRMIWECACGEGQISNFFIRRNYYVVSTDIELNYRYAWNFNFLTDFIDDLVGKNDLQIITNPPFSMKQEFYEQCKKYKIPFALLIPADYSKWIIDAIRFDGAEKIIPTRRIDFITPNKVENSSSNFHSMWLTWGLGLGKSETFVDLEIKDKENVYEN